MDKAKSPDLDNEDDVVSLLKIETDNLFFKIQESKKTFHSRMETLNLEQSNCKKFSKVIEEKKEELRRLEESINLVNEKIGDTHTQKMFVDELKKHKQDAYTVSAFEVLSYVKEAESDEACQNWLKDWSVMESQKILKTEKLKMMKHLGHFFENTEKLFEVDNLMFNNMQHKIEKVFIKNKSIVDSHDDIVTKTINIKIFEKVDLDAAEFNQATIDVDKNVKNVFNISVIDYDFMYNIIKKFLVVEVKTLACRYFEVEQDDFVLVDEKFKIWPFDVAVYDVIFTLNLEKNNTRPHSKFFHLDPAITANLKFVLVAKEDYLYYCQRNFDKLLFVDIPENIMISKI